MAAAAFLTTTITVAQSTTGTGTMQGGTYPNGTTTSTNPGTTGTGTYNQGTTGSTGGAGGSS